MSDDVLGHGGQYIRQPRKRPCRINSRVGRLACENGGKATAKDAKSAKEMRGKTGTADERRWLAVLPVGGVSDAEAGHHTNQL
jgi:hypothetical protein